MLQQISVVAFNISATKAPEDPATFPFCVRIKDFIMSSELRTVLDQQKDQHVEDFEIFNIQQSFIMLFPC